MENKKKEIDKLYEWHAHTNPQINEIDLIKRMSETKQKSSGHQQQKTNKELK